jgi:YD repeat-containing protein
MPPAVESNGQCLNLDPKTAKNRQSACELERANPINAGTGGKQQQELIYRDSNGSALDYVLQYSVIGNDPLPLAVRRHGNVWLSSFDAKLSPVTNVSPSRLLVYRNDGRIETYVFNGQAYLPEATWTDTKLKINRLTDSNGNTVGWQLMDGVTLNVETYTAQGQLASITDKNGKTAALTYGGDGRLATVTDQFGRTLTFAYDANGRTNGLTQPNGQQIQFGYDGNNNLTTVTWPDSKIRTYHYENGGLPKHLTGITDENGARYATWSYDAQGRAISSTHAGGADATTLVYNASSTVVTDARNTARTINLTTINSVVRGTSSSQPGGSGCGPASSAQTYDANGNVSARRCATATISPETWRPSESKA